VDLRIYKSGHNDGTVNSNFSGIPGLFQILETPSGAYLGNQTIPDKKKAVLDDSQIIERGATANSAGAPQRKQLFRPSDQE